MSGEKPGAGVEGLGGSYRMKDLRCIGGVPNLIGTPLIFAFLFHRGADREHDVGLGFEEEGSEWIHTSFNHRKGLLLLSRGGNRSALPQSPSFAQICTP